MMMISKSGGTEGKAPTSAKGWLKRNRFIIAGVVVMGLAFGSCILPLAVIYENMHFIPHKWETLAAQCDLSFEGDCAMSDEEYPLIYNLDLSDASLKLSRNDLEEFIARLSCALPPDCAEALNEWNPPRRFSCSLDDCSMTITRGKFGRYHVYFR